MPQTPSFAAVSTTQLARVMGSDAVARGARYAEQGRVEQLAWDPGSHSLQARVSGDTGAYFTIVLFDNHGGQVRSPVIGRCTCPVAVNCKHAAAVVMQAARGHDARTPPAGHWSELLQPVNPPHDTPVADPRSFGLQFALSPDPERPTRLRVLARPVRRTERGALSTSGVSWDRLPYIHDAAATAQLDILGEFHSLAHSVGGRRSRWSYQPTTTTVDVASIPGRYLWDLLDEAWACGLEFVHARRALGPIDPPVPVTFGRGARRVHHPLPPGDQSGGTGGLHRRLLSPSRSVRSDVDDRHRLRAGPYGACPPPVALPGG